MDKHTHLSGSPLAEPSLQDASQTELSFQELADFCLGQIRALVGEEPWQQCACVYIAYSGGLDSAILMRCLALLKTQGKLEARRLKAVHVHHGLADEADDWLQHCQQQAQELGVEFCSAKVQLPAGGFRPAGGLESAARIARYEVFEQQMDAGDVLVQGHHLDDQAETLLLRLMRGTGPKGLAGIPPVRALAAGFVVRPWLDVPKQQLMATAKAVQLNWVEDPSNQDSAIERNYLRQEIMPLLQSRWPGFTGRWGNTAKLCRESEAQLSAELQRQLELCQWRSERVGFSLSFAELSQMPEAQQWSLIRFALDKHKLPMPSRAHLQQLSQQIIRCHRADSEAIVSTGTVCFGAYRQRVYCWPVNSHYELSATQWDTQQVLPLGGGWQLIAEQIAVEPGQAEGVWLPPKVTVGTRRAFKRAKPCGRAHSQTTKKLLQERQLEPWLRDCIPFVSWQQELLAVADLWCEAGGRDHCQQMDQARFCRLIWRHLPLEQNR